MPFFSVIIPTYNREKLISATIDSIFAQSFHDFEVIVVDDGSTDRTLEVIGRYGDRVKVLRQQNGGPGAARNTGIKNARGEYVAFLDSDDLWFPWTLETYRQVIDDFKQPSYITGAPFIFSDEAAIQTVTRADLRTVAFPDYLASSKAWCWYSCSSFVIRRDVLQKVGGFTHEWVNAEDADLAMRIGEFPGFVNIKAPYLFAYREHAVSAIANIDKTYQGLDRMLRLERSGAYPGGTKRSRERTEIISRYLRPLTLELCRRGDFSRAWSLYRRMFIWNLRLGKFAYLMVFPLLSIRGLFRAPTADR
ncbi:MAG: glycosyltransferase family 2 protein [Phycisphaeraceae bacterium]|nr:glycosyltransferase family 2 protein [Phycisphaeraceae bacterium]